MTDTAAAIVTELTATPDGWYLVWDIKERRSGSPVRVRRWQPTEERELGGEQITVVSDVRSGRILAVRRYVTAELTGSRVARSASEVFAAVDATYARGLTLLRIDHQQRQWTGTDGRPVTTPVDWAKFAHRNGTYNWVSTAPNHAVVEYEVESQWDYARGRRASEQWDFDPWIAAREGTGAQLQAPAALA